MLEKKVYKRLTPKSIEFVRVLLEKSLEKINSSQLRKRSVYHGASSVAVKISRDHDSNRKMVVNDKGKKFLGSQTIISSNVNLHPFKKRATTPKPGREQKMLSIGGPGRNRVNLYDGDMVSVIEDTNKEIIIVIRQNNENKNKKWKTYYNTIIRK